MFEKAEIDIKKLRDYCLNPKHPLGKHKAQLFARHLNFYKEDANLLKRKILSGVQKQQAEFSFEDKYGVRYKVEIKIKNRNKSAIVRTIWILKKGSESPKLVTCYVIK